MNSIEELLNYIGLYKQEHYNHESRCACLNRQGLAKCICSKKYRLEVANALIDEVEIRLKREKY